MSSEQIRSIFQEEFLITFGFPLSFSTWRQVAAHYAWNAEITFEETNNDDQSQISRQFGHSDQTSRKFYGRSSSVSFYFDIC